MGKIEMLRIDRICKKEPETNRKVEQAANFQTVID